jgi:hypothetical protein
MNNPFCKSASLQYEYEDTLFYVRFDCNKIIIKRAHVKKSIDLKKADNNCWICDSHYSIPGRDRTIIPFKNKHYFIYHFTYGFFNSIPLQDLKYKLLRHTCDNSLCCNPGHLIPGTHIENMRDMVERERSCRGEDHPQAVIDEDTVRSILSSELSVDCLAAIYNISESAVRDIVNRNTWKHVKVEKVENYLENIF